VLLLFDIPNVTEIPNEFPVEIPHRFLTRSSVAELVPSDPLTSSPHAFTVSAFDIAEGVRDVE
jgi:hypothetical protein